MPAVVHHHYLEQERKLPASLLRSRFAGRVRTDWSSNAVFPHFDGQGICGYEIRNRGVIRFARGGVKGLWLSRTAPRDTRLVFCESAIDALSHAALYPDEHARYVSIGGALNPAQLEFVRAVVACMTEGSRIVAAMDADEQGRDLVEVVRQAVRLSGRGDLHFEVEEPTGGKDWNDQLRAVPALRLHA